MKNEKIYRKAFTLSYDDGIIMDKRLVEIFNKYGVKCTFNLNTGIQSRKDPFDIEGKMIHRMDQSEIGNLYEGHEIAAHGLRHLSPTELSDEELEVEYGKDIENIEKLYHKRPVGMAYAYGNFNERVGDYLKSKGIVYGRTVRTTYSFDLPKEPIFLDPTCHHKDEKLFELADKFINAKPRENEKLLFYVWGHSYEFYVDDNWDRIEKFCEIISGHEDIFYGTNEECLKLFKAI
ncbi:MAG: polysaccharide deacetylase family protein [Lachnospiraceae bacterium]|nr:polysaccharide deacetylase family protein [Lachnospiraceae bacterium]